jgi:hypothetical protein
MKKWLARGILLIFFLFLLHVMGNMLIDLAQLFGLHTWQLALIFFGSFVVAPVVCGWAVQTLMNDD